MPPDPPGGQGMPSGHGGPSHGHVTHGGACANGPTNIQPMPTFPGAIHPGNQQVACPPPPWKSCFTGRWTKHALAVQANVGIRSAGSYHWASSPSEFSSVAYYDILIQTGAGMEQTHVPGIALRAILSTDLKGYIMTFAEGEYVPTVMLPFDEVRRRWDIQSEPASTALIPYQGVNGTLDAPAAKASATAKAADSPSAASQPSAASPVTVIFAPGSNVATSGGTVSKGNGDECAMSNGNSSGPPSHSPQSPTPSANPPHPGGWQVQGGKRRGGRGSGNGGSKGPNGPPQGRPRQQHSGGGGTSQRQSQGQRSRQPTPQVAERPAATVADKTPLSNLQACKLRAMKAGYTGPYTRRGMGEYLRGMDKLEPLLTHGSRADLDRLAYIELPGVVGCKRLPNLKTMRKALIKAAKGPAPAANDPHGPKAPVPPAKLASRKTDAPPPPPR